MHPCYLREASEFVCGQMVDEDVKPLVRRTRVVGVIGSRTDDDLLHELKSTILKGEHLRQTLVQCCCDVESKLVVQHPRGSSKENLIDLTDLGQVVLVR